jgi:perosamine synthetase
MIPLFKPFMPEQMPEMNDILHSGALAYDKWGKKFESALGEYIGEEKICIVNSYNSAMLVALQVLGIKAGDEVIASPMSCLASNQPFATQGIKINWADIDPSSGTLSPESVKQMITPKTKAIFHNHFCGYPGFIDEINLIGKEYGLFVVDDAIEAFGSEYKGKRIGNINTDVTVYSFQTVRLPNTIDGGALSFKDSEHYEKAKLVRDYGVDRPSFRNPTGEIDSSFDIALPGFGATLNEVSSYIGCLQMENLENLLRMQRDNAKRWRKKLASSDQIYSPLGNASISNPNYWVFGMLVPDKKRLLDQYRKKGFYASSVHLNNNHYSVFGDSVELSAVDEFYSKFLALPSGWWIETEKLYVK